MAENEQIVDADRLIDEGRWTSFQTLTVGLCAAVVIVDGFDAQAIAYVAPVLAKDWALAPTALGSIFASVVVGMMVGALSFGPISDRRGRKLAILGSVAIMGVFSLATMFATSVEALLVLRFLTGIGLGGAMPNVIALSAEYTPTRWRSTAVGVMFCGFPFGAVLGGLLAAQIIPAYGWQSIFLVGGIAPLLLLLVLIPALPESVRFLVARGGTQRAIARLLGKAAPDVHIPAQAKFQIRWKADGGNRAAAYLELFGSGRMAITMMLWTAFLMNWLMFSFFINWLPMTLQHAGIDLSKAILFTVVLNAGGIVGTLILAPIIDRVGSFRILALVFLAAAASLFAVGYFSTRGGMPLGLAIFVAGFCVNGPQNNLNALAAGLYSTPARATGVGFAHGIGRVGSILGPLIGGALLATQMPLQTLFAIGMAPALLAALALWGLTRRPRPERVMPSETVH